jgi:hypothetical protein
MTEGERAGADNGQGTPVRAKAVLVDPASMTVVWMNESASQSAPEAAGAAPRTLIEQVVPMAAAMGVPEALRDVARGGIARHLRADVVSTAKGSMGLVTSVYRLPDGMLLVLTENAWQTGREAPVAGAPLRPRRRAR